MRAPIYVVTLILAVISRCEASPIDIEQDNLSSVDDGSSRIIDLKAPVDTTLLSDILRDSASTEFWLYTRGNPDTPQILYLQNIPSLIRSLFDPRRETVVVVHGWVSTGNTQPNSNIRNAYLEKSDVNIITVDWRRLAYTDYTTASAGVPEVGRLLGQFINWLVDAVHVNYENIHLIGFCLGAHIVGNAGRETGGRVARITGLSPAGPLWVDSPYRLTTSDAMYVEAIHTDGGENGYGMNIPIAHVDFFPNGGVTQTGCTYNLCNHNRAWELFGASVTYNHLEGYLCSSLPASYFSCRGEALRLGNDDLRKTGTPGSYYALTARSYPY